ncbi:MAG: beta-lactamase family protein, partial [Planctomycetaceae bacterium]|nr:beta-lactamase family protein [Planctomycetaceae bacterium]
MTVTDPAWASFPRVRRLIAEGIGRHHPGAQVHVAVGGQPVLEEAIGDDGHGRPLTSDHRMAWLSAGKPLTAVVALRLVERGLFRVEDRVAEYIPEFASGGKDEVTLRQLLNHTAGIQAVPTGWPRLTWGSIVERVCNAKLRHGAIPGETPAYDPQRTWFILGELLQRAVGADFEAAMASELCGPLGMERSRWTVTADASEWQSLTHECDGETCRPARDQMTPEACPAPGSSLLAPA